MFTPRALILGLIGAVVVCVWTPYNNYKVAATLLGGNQFPTVAFAVLALLAALRQLVPRLKISPAELATVWTILLVTSGIPSSGLMRTLIPNIPAPVALSTASNEWERKVWGAQPSWLKMHDETAARAFFGGYPRGQEHVPWGAWLGPLLAWGVPAVLFLLASFCVAAVFRKQWIESERFAFPLVTLPLQLATEPQSLTRRPVFWLGLVLTMSLHGLKGFHLLYPTLPDITTNWSLMDYLTEPPLNQIGPFAIFFYPLVVGLGYLLPGEVGLSVWLFHLLFKLESLIAAVNNWDQPGALGFFSQRQFHSLQAFGGAIALTAWCLWTARHHLKHVFSEPEYGRVRLGLAVSFGGLGLWELLAGVPAPLVLLSLLFVVLALVTVGWATCQAGILFMAMPYTSLDVLAPTLGTAPFSPTALYTLYRVEYATVYNTRELLLPGLLNAAKLGEGTGLGAKTHTRWLGIAVALAVVVGAWACIRLPYLSGGASMLTERWTYETGPQIPLKVLGNAASVPYKPAPSNGLHVLGGFLLVGGLLLARLRLGAGLHPIGFLAASVHGVHTTWFSILLGWLAKSLMMRYGGMGLYKAALPFFLGLIVGDVLSAAFWIGMGYVTGVGYNNLPS
ncbi:DUF6785 family protein [Armatimonas rosea]|uniref:Putative membrane protein YeaQ/YmgE (Transglycosylase-associated protein family) n=1 Tax=Armatimonas rosea TaxID=685828 RepID=A0A7W9W7C9_ARMRO|nr:DUF6785 family protein [Armatimonas rosea]MBB6051513.1 putative membrane protein YeaQ/YmgE (transglycosylase-associated protein family) [Armatimonas rosea]